MRKYPKLSIVIPTFNEERNILVVLESIFHQEYPPNKLEVFVVDNYSTDDTVKLAKKYPVKIILNPIKDAQHSKMLAYKKSTGEFFIYIDADVEFRHKKFFKILVKPLLENEKLVGAFTRMYISKKDSAIVRCLTLDPLQRDIVYKTFSPNIQEVITKKMKGYFICDYEKNKIPAAGRCLFRKKYLDKTKIAKGNKFMDLDNLSILVDSGYKKFAYVPGAGYYHHHALNFKQIIQKRLRNIKRNYLPDVESRYYKWFSADNPLDVLKIFFLVVYANLFFPALIIGIYNTFKYKDRAGLMEPFISIIAVDVIIWGFLKEKKGRALALRMLKNFVTNPFKKFL